MKKFDFNKFLLEKGERAGLYAAAGLAVLLLFLFFGRSLLFTAGASTNAKKLEELSKKLREEQARAQPGEQHKPPPVREVDSNFRQKLIVAAEFPTTPHFIVPGRRDEKRQRPTILAPESFQAEVVLAQLKVLAVDINDKGEVTHVWIAEGDVGTGEAMPPGVGPSMSSGRNLSNYLSMYNRGPTRGGGGDGGFAQPPGIGGAGKGPMDPMGQPPEGSSDKKIKVKRVSLATFEKNGGRLTYTVEPRRLAVVAGAFPFQAQVEEFRNKLRKKNHYEVLTAVNQYAVQTPTTDTGMGMGTPMSSGSFFPNPQQQVGNPEFEFKGFEVRRMTLLPGDVEPRDDKGEPIWEDITEKITDALKELYRLTGKEFDKETNEKITVSVKLDKRVETVTVPINALKPFSKRLYNGLPPQFDQKASYPALWSRMEPIKKTIENLVKEENKKNAIQPPASQFDKSKIDPFDDTPLATSGVGMGGMGDALGGGGGPPVGPPVGPPRGGMGEGGYYFGGNEQNADKDADTPVLYSLFRFIDPTVEPGMAYRYQIRIKMTNPNYAKDPKARTDTYPPFARDEFLFSEWTDVRDENKNPLIIRVPPESFIYAVDQKQVDPKLPSDHRQIEPNFQLYTFLAGHFKAWRDAYLAKPANNRWTNEPDSAVVQIHRWLTEYQAEGRSEAMPLGDWVIAPRLLVYRGEFIRTWGYEKIKGELKKVNRYLTKVTIKPKESTEYELDSRAISVFNKTYNSHWMNVPMGDDSVLVDFEGGDKKGPQELLIFTPDGRLIARNSAEDTNDEQRKARYAAWKKRIEELEKAKTSGGSGTGNPFGTGGGGTVP